MSTKLQKRLTKQGRYSAEWHKRLKLESVIRGIPMSRILDDIIELFFEAQSTKNK